MKIYKQLSELDFSLSDLPTMPRADKVLLTTPMYFDVEYVINPHMEGNVGDVDIREAIRQWTALKDAYRSTGFDVTLVHGLEGLPDMVFCANQTLPYIDASGDKRGFVMSRMHSPYRRPEVHAYRHFFTEKGYDIIDLPDSISDFEGMGDAIWHPGRRLLWGGYGFRSSMAAYEFLSAKLDIPIIAVELNDPDFYHLDTCLSVLDESTCLIYPGAFEPEALELLRDHFDTVLEAPEDEARNLFATNAHCPDGMHVFIQDRCHGTNQVLAEAGYLPVSLQTDEFLKSGGSVFCMKQMYW